MAFFLKTRHRHRWRRLYLTKESVSAYINKITLYEDKRIEIEFKLQDELLELAKKLEEGVVRCQMISA